MPKAREDGYVLGVKIDSERSAVWATDNTPSSASLHSYELETGKLRRTASIPGKHVFNDLAISTTGTVYVTDTAEGSVYQLPSGMLTLRRVAPQHSFTAANGIAISADERLLYVSTWEDGIDVIDLRSGTVKPVIHPDNICLAFIDGLYASQHSLIAIQNGPMLPRIVEFRLDGDRQQIVAMRILERRNPAFDGITTGVIVGNEFYYVANPQTEKNGPSVNPLRVLGVRIAP
jgi:DNA-binding beta-propeller fold protein YncE